MEKNMNKIIKLSTIIFSLLFASHALADKAYSYEARQYQQFIDKVSQDKENTKVETKNVDFMEEFNNNSAELVYQKENGSIGATTEMTRFYNYKVATDDGNVYLFNKQKCFINPNVKKVQVITRKWWGYFLLPVDTSKAISDPKDCSAVKMVKPEMQAVLDKALKG